MTHDTSKRSRNFLGIYTEPWRQNGLLEGRTQRGGSSNGGRINRIFGEEYCEVTEVVLSL